MGLKELTIRKPDDFHCHLRNGDMLKSVLLFTASVFGRVIVMPNTEPPILTHEDVSRYNKKFVLSRSNGVYHLLHS